MLRIINNIYDVIVSRNVDKHFNITRGDEANIMKSLPNSAMKLH